MSEFTVTIIYPCYNQPEMLAASLQSLVRQTRKDFTVLLVDDCSTANYDGVISLFPQLIINRVVNEKNIGAVPNMLHCLRYPVTTPYKMVFHEDDLLHPQWLEFAVPALQNNPRVAWVGSNMSFFKTPSSVNFQKINSVQDILLNDTSRLASCIIEGNALSFASILYNCRVIKNISIPFNDYSVLVDRYLLLDLAKNKGFVYFLYNFISVYDHSGVDNRWKSLKIKHISNYLHYLREYFSENQLRSKVIISGFTRMAVDLVGFISFASLIHKILLYFNLKKAGIFSLKYYLLTFKSFRQLSDFIQKNN